jgi:hypothetical protein
MSPIARELLKDDFRRRRIFRQTLWTRFWRWLKK